MRSLNRLMIATLAVAGSTAALAQSSVQVYGRVNTSVERQKVGDVSTTGLFNNASRIGFRGTEDLGGGLKAGFWLEGEIFGDNGNANGFKPVADDPEAPATGAPGSNGMQPRQDVEGED